jgi:hypothetical protein
MQTSFRIGDLVADFQGKLGVVTIIDKSKWVKIQWVDDTFDWFHKTRIHMYIELFKNHYGNR